MEPQWLKWAKELGPIAQNGLLHASDKPYDAQRCKRIREIASEMMAVSGAASFLGFQQAVKVRQTQQEASFPHFDLVNQLILPGRHKLETVVPKLPVHQEKPRDSVGEATLTAVPVLDPFS